MTLADFITWLKNHADSFQEFYSEERRKNPEDFPYELDASEWFEQFIMFDEKDKED